jgi:hypothetical protein
MMSVVTRYVLRKEQLEQDDADGDKGVKNNHIKGIRCSTSIDDALT